jgi:hypothetical protein
MHIEKIHFFERFITEREAIRLKKELGIPAPWTDDPVLARWRFTNVRRRDDRMSRWLLRDWYPTFPFAGLWHAAVVARVINWAPTLARVRFACGNSIRDFDADRFATALMAVSGEKVFGGAYVVPGGAKGVPKPVHIAGVIASMLEIKPDIEAAIDDRTVEGVVKQFARIRGIGEFLAGQFVADLTYLEAYGLNEARDLYTWAPQGPGSSKGFNILLDRPPGAAISDEEWRAGIAKLTAHGRMLVPDMTAMDCQNCLCEISKIVGYVRGLSRPKAEYQPHTY